MSLHDATTVVPATPYCGIQSFRYADQAIFFAREEETARLASLVSVYRGVMLYGDSGAGKSSLVNAGLLPRMTELGVQPERVRVQPLRDGELVVGRIPTADDGSAWLPSALADDATAERAVLSVEAFEERVLAACEDRRLLLVFDQFEELCTLFETQEERAVRRRIVELVTRLMRGPAHVKLLFVFREDYLARVKDLLGSCPELVDQALRLSPLAVDALPTAIRGPFERHPGHYDHELSPRLAGRLCDAFAERSRGGEISLSEVQTVCLRLWQAPEADALFEQKGVQGLLEDSLGEALASFRRDVRFASTALLGHMVTAAGTRNVVSADDLVQRVRKEDPALSRELVEEALERLEQDTRLVRRESRRDLDLYEITSEFLVPWISEQRAEAERARELQTARRRQRALAAIAVLLGLVVGGVTALALWAIHQRSDAQHAASSATGLALTGASVVERYERLDVSLLLALGGYEAQPGFQERSALVAALQRIAGNAAILHGSDATLADVALDSRHGLVAAGGADHAVRLWSMATHRQVAVLRGHTGMVQSVAFSPGGRLLASGSADGTVRLWSVAARRQLGAPLRVRHVLNETFLSVAFSPDGRTLASAGTDGSIRLWSVARRRQLGRAISVSRALVNAVAFSPDGRTLASAGADGTVRLWSVAARRQLGRTLVADGQPVLAVAFSPDGSKLASGGQDELVRLWSVATHMELGLPMHGHVAAVKDVAFSPDGRVLASAGWDSTVRLWSVATHGQLGDPLNEQTGAVQGVAFSADGRTLASADWDGSVRLHDLAAPRELGSPLGAAMTAPVTHLPISLRTVAFSPNGRLLAAASFSDEIQLWDVVRRRKLGKALRYAGSSLQDIAFSPDGRTLAGVTFTDVVAWDVATHRRARPPVPEDAFVSSDAVFTAGAFSPDGHAFALADADGTVRLWDVRRRRRLGAALRGHSGQVDQVAFSPDGRLLASAGEDRTVRLWSVAAHRRVAVLRGHTDGVTHVAFSPDGRLLASGSDDGSVRLWDVARRRQLGPELSDRSTHVFGLAFSPRGDVLATDTNDVGVQLWSVRDRTPLGLPLSLGGSDVAFSPNGLTLATAGYDGRAYLWSGFLWNDFGALARRVCHTVGGDLSRGEWVRYVPGVPYRRICGS